MNTKKALLIVLFFAIVVLVVILVVRKAAVKDQEASLRGLSLSNVGSVQTALRLQACPTGYSLCVAQNGTPTAVTTLGTNGSHDKVTMVIPMKITAGARNVYIPMNAVQAAALSNSSRIQFQVENNGTSVLSGATSSFVTLTSAIPSTSTGHYMIPASQAGEFKLTVVYTPSTAGTYRTALVNLPWSYVDHSNSYTGDAATGFVNSTAIQLSSIATTPYVSAR